MPENLRPSDTGRFDSDWRAAWNVPNQSARWSFPRRTRTTVPQAVRGGPRGTFSDIASDGPLLRIRTAGARCPDVAGAADAVQAAR
jgi:hypothetical protein